MTRRIDSPDTQTDRDLRNHLEQGVPGFTMISGAGSGKTTSLVKALAHIVDTHGAELRSEAQRVACITYTEVAAAEISADLAESPLAHVSTIHSFLWTVIAPFQEDIRKWVRTQAATRIEKELGTAAAAAATGNRQQDASEQAVRYESIQRDVEKVPRFRYGTGRDFAKGILGHYEVLTMVPQMIMDKPQLASLVARRFPFVLVDESQDTFENVVQALKHVAQVHPARFTLGFFGDPMQKIYTTGVGNIEVPSSWPALKKPENFRSASRILDLINAIRAKAGDALEQSSGLDSAEQISGEVTFVVLPAGATRSQDLNRTVRWLADNSALNAWADVEGQPGAKILVIAHRMAARRLGYENLYEAFHGGRSALSTAFDEGTAWPLTPLRDIIFPLAHAAKHARHKLIPLLMAGNPELRERAETAGGTKDFLAVMSGVVAKLKEIVDTGGTGSVGTALEVADANGLLKLDSRLSDAIDAPESSSFASLNAPLRDALASYVACDITEVRRYLDHLEATSPYATHQGVKGAEFRDVVVVLDDEEGRHTSFSYDKLLNLKKASPIDLQNREDGKDTVFERTWRLLYVCASRARRALAVVLFAADTSAGVAALSASGLPGTEKIVTLQDMSTWPEGRLF